MDAEKALRQARELLTYDQETGVSRWRLKRNGISAAGAEAGFATVKGYTHIGLNRKTYKAHRLAWLMVYERWPEGLLDHINGDKADNRIANLREATESQNGANRARHKNNTTGFPGVSKQNGGFVARVSRDGIKHYLGTFRTAEDAAVARDEWIKVNRYAEFATTSESLGLLTAAAA